MIDNPEIDYWDSWLKEIATVLKGTGTGRVAAQLWAGLIGVPDPAQMRAVRRAVLLDEQCSRLGRVLPGDVLRLLRDDAMSDVPRVDEAIAEIWRQVRAVGRYAANSSTGFDGSRVRFSHPVVGAMADAAGWIELCDCTERGVMDGQLRRYHEQIVARWRSGVQPSPPRGFRCEIEGVTPPPPPIESGATVIPLVGRRLELA